MILAETWSRPLLCDPRERQPKTTPTYCLAVSMGRNPGGSVVGLSACSLPKLPWSRRLGSGLCRGLWTCSKLSWGQQGLAPRSCRVEDRLLLPGQQPRESLV